MKNELQLESQKTSATILPSQWEIIKTLPKSQQLEVISALFEYELYGIEPKSSIFEKNKMLKTFWLMSKPLIDKRIRRAENGRKGGLANGGKSKPKANQKQNESKKKQSKSKREADKDKDKDMDMDKEYPYPSRISLDAYPVGTDIKDDYIDREDEELPVDENGNWIWPDE
jgi:hypothetical protein